MILKSVVMSFAQSYLVFWQIMKRTKVPDYYEYYTKEEYEALKELERTKKTVNLEQRDAKW